VADSAELVSLAGLPGEIAIDAAAGTVSVPAAARYGDLAGHLDRAGLALANLASLPHISVAGSVATATHGSGDALGNLATHVAGLDLVTASGELLGARRGDDGFEGLVVGLGALGVVTRLDLDAEPAYEVRQRVYEGLAWDVLLDRLDEVMASGDSVSVFTRYGPAVEQIWVKSRVGSGPEHVRDDLGTRAVVEHHPVPGNDPASCTPQLGVPGPWSDRLPHFRLGFTPSAGDELQAEYFVPRRLARPALAAVHGLAAAIRPRLLVSEIRTTAADELWLSPQHDQDTVSIHFTWRPEPEPVAGALAALEEALAPLGARPHWGKLFRLGAERVRALYPRVSDFERLAARLDPHGTFRNDWLERHVLG
jgi:xylitol oxidase